MIPVYFFRLLPCWLILIQILSACANRPVYKSLSTGLTVEPVTQISAGAPFAPDPTGRQVALAQNGVALFDVSTRAVTLLSPDIPLVLAWAPDGHRLAAVFRSEGGSHLRIYDTTGSILGTSSIPGKVGALLWRGNNELLVAALELKVYSFGANFIQVLYQWDGTNQPMRSELVNSTLRSTTYHALGPELHRLFTITISPFSDAIIYPRLLDPPMFTTYLRFKLRNLASGSERDVASTPIGAGGVTFAGPDDTLLYGNGSAETVLRAPWGQRDLTTFPHPGNSLAASPGGSHLFIDGRLYLNSLPQLVFPADARAIFNHDGTRLFVLQAGQLFLVSGLPPDPPPTVTVDNRERYLTLRRWRSEGLITPADFMQETKKMEKP